MRNFQNYFVHLITTHYISTSNLWKVKALVLSLLLPAFGLTQYCIPSASGGNTVFFGEICFPIPGDDFHNCKQTNVGSDYKDFTGLGVRATYKESTPNDNKILLGIDNPGTGTYYYSVYIDLNQDDDFDDSGEAVIDNTQVNPTSGAQGRTGHFLSLTIPAGATAGNTRLRAMVKHSSQISGPCETGFNGEVEDYLVEIEPTSACTDPVISNLSATSTNICPGSSTTITVTGTLNSATSWVYYTAGCGTGSGTTISGTSFTVSPSSNTTYYVRGEGGCVSNASCTQITINVGDSTPPTFSNCPSNMTKGTDNGQCTANVSWTHPTVNDNCPNPTLSVAYTNGTPAPPSLPSGGSVTAGSGASVTFQKSQTIVTYTATDAGGNQVSTCSFTVTVSDNENPTFSSCPSDINMSTASGLCNKSISWRHPTANDNCSGAILSVTYTDGSPAPANRPSDGNVTSAGSATETFDKGETIVTYTITDCGNNQVSTCSFKVTLTDDENPSFSNCPSDVSMSTAAGLCDKSISWTHPTANDNCSGAILSIAYTDGSPAPANRPSDGNETSGGAATETFDKGETIVTYTITDCGNNQVSTCSFKVTLTDDENPVISNCPSNISQGTDNGVCEADISWTHPTLSDNCPGATMSVAYTDGSPSPDFRPTDGSANSAGSASETFAVGQTIVTYSAVDCGNNVVSTCSFTVDIVDDEKPSISCPSSFSVNNDPNTCEAVVTLPKSTNSDNCAVDEVEFRYREMDENNNYIGSWSSWDDEANCTVTFPVGYWKVRWRAKDDAGNSKGCNFNLDVIDNVPPVALCQDITVQLNNGTAAVDPSAINNGSSDNCGIDNLSVDLPTVDCSNLGDNLVNLTVTDVNGNASSCPATVHILGPTVTIEDITQLEGTGTGFTFYFFKVDREGETCGMTVDYATSDGTATLADNDYVAGSGTHFWPLGGGNTRYSIVRAVKDSNVEPDETFHIDLSNPSAGLVITDNRGDANIDNDDTNSLIGTSGIEICDGYDNDADGLVDEGFENANHPGSIALTNQNEVNNFPTCIARIEGYLFIQGIDITDLSPLENLKSIGKDLIIINTSLSNLNGLNHLVKIDGALFISNNKTMKSLRGLEHLAEVEGDFTIYQNFNLNHCCPIQPLLSKGIGGETMIVENSTGCENQMDVTASCRFYSEIPCSDCPSYEFVDLEVFPNPATNEINVVVVGQEAGEKLLLVDILGRTVIERNLEEGQFTYKLSTGDLKRGIYWASVFHKGVVKTKKVVLE